MGLSRRVFIGFMAALPFSGLFGRKGRASGEEGDVLLNRFSAAGFQYYEGPSLVSAIRPGDELILKPEPENVHDRYAVEIYRGAVKLGYVPRSDNKHISRLLRQGKELKCEAWRVRPEEAPWNMLTVKVYLRGA